MKFDYQALIDQLKTLFIGTYAEKWPVVMDAVVTYISDAEERLTLLAENFIEEKDTEFLSNRLSEEKFLLWSQIRSFEVLAEATAEKLANDAVLLIGTTITGLTSE